jgi:hypothetical protein
MTLVAGLSVGGILGGTAYQTALSAVCAQVSSLEPEDSIRKPVLPEDLKYRCYAAARLTA